MKARLRAQAWPVEKHLKEYQCLRAKGASTHLLVIFPEVENMCYSTDTAWQKLFLFLEKLLCVNRFMCMEVQMWESTEQGGLFVCLLACFLFSDVLELQAYS